MKYSHLFLIILFIPVSGLAYKVYRTDEGKPIRWYRDKVIMVGDIRGTTDIAGNGEWQAVQASMKTWNGQTCKQPTLAFNGLKKDLQAGYWPDGDNYNVISWLDDKDVWQEKYPGGDDVIAFTTVIFDLNSGKIFDADMELNDWTFDFTVDPSRSTYDVQNTVTHELGHVLGMDHSKDHTATMYYSANPGDINKRTLAQDDTNGLCYLYGADWLDVTPEHAETAEINTKDDSSGCTQSTHTSSPYAILIILSLFMIVLKLRTRKAR